MLNTTHSATVAPVGQAQNRVNPDEAALWSQYVANRGNTELRNRILARYMNLMWWSIARFLRLHDKPMATARDYLGSAWMGLVRAAEGFDPSRGIQFKTYATNGILWALGRGDPRPSHGEIRRMAMRKKRTLASHAIGMRANDHDLAEYLKTSEAELTANLCTANNAHHVAAGEFHGVNDAAKVPDPSDRATVADTVNAGLKLLATEQREVVVRVIGHGATENELASERGLSTQRISQILIRSVDRIRSRLSPQGSVCEFIRPRSREKVSIKELAEAKAKRLFPLPVAPKVEAVKTLPRWVTRLNASRPEDRLTELRRRQQRLTAWLRDYSQEDEIRSNAQKNLRAVSQAIALLEHREQHERVA